MRLDEWQKFIESQFLEETVPEPAPVKPAARAVPDPQTALLLDDEPITLPEGVSDEEPPTTLLSTAPPEAASEAQAAAEEPAPARPLPPPVTTQRQSGFVVQSIVEPPAPILEPLPAVSPVPFASDLDLDPDIPVFANYLPSKSAPPESVSEEPEVIASLLEEEVTAGPVSVLMPMTTGFVSALSAPTPPADSRGDGSPTERRRKRAPQARNVQPEGVASGLSSADLWSKVPRHVQTLLALERREEEREVAQSSYKRPFQEKRAELIARILDPILSLEDTARLLNVCPTTVRRYTNKGILTHYRKEPDNPSANISERETRQRRFRLSDILTFLETQQTALEADRLQERVAPSRRKRVAESLEAASSE